LRQTITKLEYFERLLNNPSFDQTDIRIDTDYELFRHILNRLRNHNYIYPEELKDNIEEIYCFYAGIEQKHWHKIYSDLRFDTSRESSIEGYSTKFYQINLRNRTIESIMLKFVEFESIQMSARDRRVSFIDPRTLYNFFKPAANVDVKGCKVLRMRKSYIREINEFLNCDLSINFIVVGTLCDLTIITFEILELSGK
jgi:hypothetical protein